MKDEKGSGLRIGERERERERGTFHDLLISSGERESPNSLPHHRVLNF